MQNTISNAQERMIIALDFPEISHAKSMIETLGDAGKIYKIGFEMVLSGGLTLAEDLASSGNDVFLDMKLLDIPNTIEKAAAAAARLGVKFLTIHGYPFALEAARKGVDSVPGAKTKILSVTVMTSVSQPQLTAAGYSCTTRELIEKRALQAIDLGIDGLILSAQDIEPLREIVGDQLLFVTPGIRPLEADNGDQMRVMDPKTAMQTGSDYLVIGRPITQHADPRKAAIEIAQSMAEGMALRKD